MSRRARIITSVVLLAAAVASILFAISLVQVTGGNLTTTVTSRVPDWSTSAAPLVVALGIIALAAVVGAVIALPKRRSA